MNMPPHPESSLQFPPLDREAPRAGSYAPSVPISVYRELAAELNATKAMVDALTSQNQQLTQQNTVLRQEFLRFADSADQLRQAIAYGQETSGTTSSNAMALGQGSELAYRQEGSSVSENLGPHFLADGVANLAAQMTRLGKPNPTRSEAPAKSASPKSPGSPTLYTEQRPEPLRQTANASRSQDMSGLWLATTILVIVFSAFGAGFLIMKPLLGSGR